MNYLKKNIWKLFYILVVLGLFVSFIIAYMLWTGTYKEQKTKQESLTLLYKNSIYSILSQYESILELLGDDLLQDNIYKDRSYSLNKLDKMLKLNPALIGFELVSPSGELLLSSIKNYKTKAPNLLKKEETKKSFLEVLNSKDMVIGRTYFHKTLKTYIIPIRKAIRDKKGKVLGVMTAGIKADSGFNIIDDTKDELFNVDIVIARDTDYYRQLVISKEKRFKVYDKPVPKKLINYILEQISEQNSGITLDEIKNKEKIYTVFYYAKLIGEKHLSSISYINQYKLWVSVESKLDDLMSNFYLKLLPLFVSYIVFILILQTLFKQIYKIEEKKKEELKIQAEHDYLTKLNNRYYLSKKFDSCEFPSPFSLIILNVDNFRNINKNFGHKYGDFILKELSKRLLSIKNESDILARYSGDEFLFIRFDIDKNETKELVKNILKLFSKPFVFQNFSVVLSASAGVTGYPSDGDSFDEVKRYADIALQEAKAKKNGYVIFEDELKEKHLRRSMIEEELKSALKEHEIYMVYQPQIRANGNFYGVEALVRWENKKLGFIPPDEFINIAEHSGMMVKLGQYIIDTSLREISKIQRERNIKFQLSINISLRQFIEPSFYEDLLQSIKDSNFDKSFLTLEVTESLFIEDLESILGLLERIKKDGIKISLDDFGTGYSSLSLLKKLPIDELKIDKSFVDDIEYDEDSVKMARGIILIAKQLNMELLAEGIENLKQKELLVSYGCDLFQGYYFSRPLKKEVLVDFIKV